MTASKSKAISKPTVSDEDEVGNNHSRAVLFPAVTHAVVTQAYGQRVFSGKLDKQIIYDGIAEKAAAVVAGDMSSSERMLVAQATSLNSICVSLFLRAEANMGEYRDTAEVYMKLALKAQNQCRMTLETLAAIKNPPVVYARQANFAAGPQQVNNGVSMRAAKNENAPNELLEDGHDEGERLDGGAPGKAIGSNPAVAAVGAINRTAKR